MSINKGVFKGGNSNPQNFQNFLKSKWEEVERKIGIGMGQYFLRCTRGLRFLF